MDAPERGALMLVRFIAVALIGISVIEFALNWLENSVHHTSLTMVQLIWPAIFLLLGIISLIKAGLIAKWLSDKLDL